jgi:hypothetical protein
MRRGLWVRSVIILAVVSGLQVASLALTCAEHWGLPTAQHHHSASGRASDPTSHHHSHEECSLQGTPAGVLVVPGFDCFCADPSSIALLGVPPVERVTAVDDFYYDRILLEIFFRPPIF